MMMAFLAAPRWTMMRIPMVPHATISLVSGVQEGGCDGAWRNKAQRTRWIDGSEHEEVGKEPAERPGCPEMMRTRATSPIAV